MHALIDLDGTILDPAPGILGSVELALAKLGLPAPPRAELSWVVGPPLRQSFPLLGVAAADVERAIAYYRDNYRSGAMYEAEVYAGMPEALDELRAAGFRLVVATSKPHVFARPILERFGLASRFETIHGAELDGRNDDKADLIAHIVASEGIDPARAVMVGDRRFDVIGAARNQISTIGITWGHGSEEELVEAGAAALCREPARLAALAASLSKPRLPGEDR